MSTYLIQSSLILSTPSRAIMYDEAISLSNNGHKVFYMYCGGLTSQCFINLIGDRATCRECKSFCKNERKRFSSKFEFVSANDLVSTSQKEQTKALLFDYTDVNDIKQLTFEGLNIGYGVVSAYITVSRNMNPLIDSEARIFFDENLRNAALYVLAIKESVKRYTPDHIILYNGRFADSRPCWELAVQNNIPYTTLEAIYGLQRNYKASYPECTPFSMSYTKTIADNLWNAPEVSMEYKTETGALFFERRRNAQYTGDKIYVKDQQEGLLPQGWNPNKHNIVIFNSSEDEFAAVGGEFEEKTLFKLQLDGLNYIKDYFKNDPNVDITLRIHPNLSTIKYSYATDLHKLHQANFRVIEGTSPISTYSLLDSADVIVVFGSTMGAEANYWQKPVVLLGAAMYYYFDCCYIPASISEAMNMISTKNLAPKSKINSIKYGYMLLTEQWEVGANLDFDWSYKTINALGLNRRLQINNWLKTCNSRRLYSLLRAARLRFYKLLYLCGKRHGNRLTIPTKEMQEKV